MLGVSGKGGVMPSADPGTELEADPADDRVKKAQAGPDTDVSQEEAQKSSGPPQWLRSAGIGSWSIIGLALVVAGTVFATARISAVFIAVFVALVFTALLNPIVAKLAKHMPRGLSVLLALLGSVLVFSGLVGFVVASVAGQWTKLLQQLADGLDKIVDFLNNTPFHLALTSDEVYEWFETLIKRGQDYVTDNWQKLAGTVMSNAGGVFIFFTIFALSVFLAVFFLLQGAQMWRWFLNMLPTRSRGKWNHAAQAGWWSFSGYARGTMIIALIDGVLAWIFLEIVQVPLAAALAVMVMIGALIPMIGAPAAMLLAMIVALATDGVGAALVVGIGIAAIGQLEGHVLQPLIMGRQVSLHPVVVGLAVVVGTLLAGLLGAIIATPIVGVSWAVFNALYHRDPPIVGPLPDSEPPPAPVKPTFLKKLFSKHHKDQSKKKSAENSADAAPAS